MVVVCCLVDYVGWLSVYLLFVICLFVVKVDGSVFVYLDLFSYKLLNWMSLLVVFVDDEVDEECVVVGVI